MLNFLIIVLFFTKTEKNGFVLFHLKFEECRYAILLYCFFLFCFVLFCFFWVKFYFRESPVPETNSWRVEQTVDSAYFNPLYLEVPSYKPLPRDNQRDWQLQT